MTPKNKLRSFFLNQRLCYSQIEIEAMSHEISLNLMTFNFQSLKISSFLPIANKNEINTLAFIEQIELCNDVFVPVIDSSGENLIHFPFKIGDALVETKYGISEPKNKNFPLPNTSLNVVIVPLVIADQSGHRLGYGKGFYDRLFAETKNETLKIGLSFFEPIDEIPFEKHDKTLTHLVTPKHIYVF